MKCIVFKLVGCLLAFSLIGVGVNAASDTPQSSGYWYGTSDFLGFNSLIEIHTALDSDGMKNSRISIYGPAPLHYEFPLVFNKELEANPLHGGKFSLSMKLRGQEFTFRGENIGGVITGKINGSNSFQLYQGPDQIKPDEDALVGLYQGDEANLFVTYREFGGLRAVNLETGENFTLLQTAPRNYFTWQGLIISDPRGHQVRFPRNSEGQVMALVFSNQGVSETYYKSDYIQQTEINFIGQKDNLAGTIISRTNGSNLPGLVLVHGSGPIYRTALLQKAVMFAENGFGVLIYDKRGTGLSGGRWQDASLEDIAVDAVSALEVLEAQTFIDKTRTGFQGHSQAGYVLPIAAAKSDIVDFVIIVNGGSITPWEQSLYDKENDLIREGFGTSESKTALALMRGVFAYVLRKEGDYEALNQAYLKALDKPWFEILDFPRMENLPTWEENPEILEAFKAEISFDPKVYQRKMTVPVLVLLGEDDETVPAGFVANIWRNTMAEAGNPFSEIIIIPGTGHGMRQSGSGPYVPDYSRRQIEWLRRIFDRSSE